MSRSGRLLGALVFFTLFFAASAANGGMQFSQGWWKAEVTGGLGLDITTIDRGGDILGTIVVEYEFPAGSRFTLGLRLIPLLLYEQDEDETIWGGGFGVASRYYFREREYRGWYIELEGHSIVHEKKISANTSNFNFLIGGGLGYRFRNDWHGAVKFEHISNGGLGTRNQATNTISFALGYSF
jgi:hypothetical protein